MNLDANDDINQIRIEVPLTTNQELLMESERRVQDLMNHASQRGGTRPLVLTTSAKHSAAVQLTLKKTGNDMAVDDFYPVAAQPIQGDNSGFIKNIDDSFSDSD